MAHLVNKYNFSTEKDMFKPPAIVDPTAISWYKDTVRKKPEVTVSTYSKDKLLTGTDVLSAKLREALSASRPRESSTLNHYSQYLPKSSSDPNAAPTSGAAGQYIAVNNYVNSLSNSAGSTRKLDLYGATDYKRSIAMSNDVSSMYPSRHNDMKSSNSNFPANNYISTYNSTYITPSSTYGNKGTSSSTTQSYLTDYSSSRTPAPPVKKESKKVDFVLNNSRPKTTTLSPRSATVSRSGQDLIDYSTTNIQPKAPTGANDEYYMRKMGEILNVHYGPLFTSNPSMITDYMYVGGYKDAENWQQLRRLGITHVLNMAAVRRSSYNPYPPQSGVVGYEAFDADDHEGYNVMQHFPKAKAFIDRARWSGGKVLVHCAMGVNRSGTMCCAYLMSEHKIPLIEAARKMKRSRGTTLTNRGFQRQLVKYARQKHLLG